MTAMRMLFLGLNYAPEEIGIGLYSAEMLCGWVSAGNDADAVVAHPYYPRWRVFDGYGGGWNRASEAGVEVLRCPLYVPANPKGGRRILHHISFAASSFVPMLKRAVQRKPELIFTTAPSLIATPVALIAAKLCGARTWLHVQDFEVEAAHATGFVEGNSLFARWARSLEGWLLRSFDTVSSISPQMCARLCEKGVAPHRVYEFRNWANIDAITPRSSFTSSYRAEWGIETPQVALYSGNIGNKQGIELVVDAAQLLAERRDILFVICGEGPNRARLERKAAHLPNIRFYDLQPKQRLDDLLAMATIHLLPQLAGAADLVLPSKLTNMLASGKPVIATADPGTGLAEEVVGAGIITPPGDARAFAEAIVRLVDDPQAASRYGLAARDKAEQRWGRASIIKQFILRANEADAG